MNILWGIILSIIFLFWVLLEVRSLKEKVARLESISLHDDLTGFLNRRGLEKVLTHHFSILLRSHGEENNLSILYLDLNRFKEINDRYGHTTGDEVLKFFARFLKRAFRDSHDILARIGGDEFVVILPGCNEESAHRTAEKIRYLLPSYLFDLNNPSFTLSTSIGVASTFHQENGSLCTIADLLDQADQSMYRDKIKQQKKKAFFAA